MRLVEADVQEEGPGPNRPQVLGGLGGVVGAFTGYEARTRLVRALKVKDRVIALSEDVVAIVLAWLFVSWR